MKPVTRRSVMAGSAAAVAAVPVVAVATLAEHRDPLARVKELTRALEDAMLAAYGGRSKVLTFGPHSETEKNRSGLKSVFVVVHDD